jgi:hypothetical protein
VSDRAAQIQPKHWPVAELVRESRDRAVLADAFDDTEARDFFIGLAAALTAAYPSATLPEMRS